MAKTYKYHFIYHIRILIGSKKNYFYVGLHSTNNIDDGYCGSGTVVKDIIKSYRERGYKDNEIYKRTIITFATSRKEVVELEAMYVDKNILLNEYSLNEKTGGDANVEYSDELCKKISDANKGKFTGENNPMFGTRHSDETRAKMSKAAQGRKHSDETCAKIAKSNTGRKHSDETIAKMSKNNGMKGKKNQDFMTESEIKKWCKNISKGVSSLTWVHNDELKKDARKKGEELIEYLNNGWVEGRKYSISNKLNIKGTHRVYHKDGTFHMEKNAA